MAARMGPLVLPRTPYAVSSARNNFKIDRYLNLSTSQISDRYWDVVKKHREPCTMQRLSALSANTCTAGDARAI